MPLVSSPPSLLSRISSAASAAARGFLAPRAEDPFGGRPYDQGPAKIPDPGQPGNEICTTPGMPQDVRVSPDGKTYTFKLRAGMPERAAEEALDLAHRLAVGQRRRGGVFHCISVLAARFH